jgi:hypothetical protein
LQWRQNRRPEIVVEKSGDQHASAVRWRLARAHSHDLRRWHLTANLDCLLTPGRLLRRARRLLLLRAGRRRAERERACDENLNDPMRHG